MTDDLPPLLPRDRGFVVPPAQLDPMSERFADLWRKLDASPLRPVWPIALGAVIAGLSLLVVRSILLAGVISLVVVLAMGWFGRSVARRLEELDRLSD